MSDDTIYRAEAIDAVKKNTFRLTFAEEQNGEGHVAWSAEAVYSDVMEGALLELPSAQPSISKTEIVGDVISRQAVLALPRNITRNMRGEVVEETIDVAAIKALPPAQLERETTTVSIGRTKGSITIWYECDACGEPVDKEDAFCRRCGRRLNHE